MSPLVASCIIELKLNKKPARARRRLSEAAVQSLERFRLKFLVRRQTTSSFVKLNNEFGEPMRNKWRHDDRRASRGGLRERSLGTVWLLGNLLIAKAARSSGGKRNVLEVCRHPARVDTLRRATFAHVNLAANLSRHRELFPSLSKFIPTVRLQALLLLLLKLMMMMMMMMMWWWWWWWW